MSFNETSDSPKVQNGTNKEVNSSTDKLANSEFDGALVGLHEISSNDLEKYKNAVELGLQNGFGYCFAGLLAYGQVNRNIVLLSEDEGSVCVFRLAVDNHKQRLDLLLAPAPMNVRVLKRCLERANEFNGDNSARILKIDEKDADAVSSIPALRVKTRKSQYLYAPENFKSLSGNKFRNVRRYVNKVQSLDGLEVLPYSEAYEEACIDLLRKWRTHHREAHGTKGGVGKTRRIIKSTALVQAPDLQGEVILIKNVVVGFAFGGEIRRGHAAFLEAKCDHTVPGLSYFQRYSFMSKLTHCQIINDGPDVGRAGLAQLKNSLRPVTMHIEYQAGQRSARRPK